MAVQVLVDVRVRRPFAQQLLAPLQLRDRLRGDDLRGERAGSPLVEPTVVQELAWKIRPHRRKPRQVQMQSHRQIAGCLRRFRGIRRVHQEGRGGHHAGAHRLQDPAGDRRVVAEIVSVENQGELARHTIVEAATWIPPARGETVARAARVGEGENGSAGSRIHRCDLPGTGLQPSIPCVVFPDFLESGGRDQAEIRGVPGRLESLPRQHEGNVVGANVFRERPYLALAPSRGHVADVDGANPLRVLERDLPVDFGILLSAVSDQDERERGIGGHQHADSSELVLSRSQRLRGRLEQAEVAQEDRPAGNLVELEEREQEIVEVPRALGDVKERVGAGAARPELERAIEGAHSRKRGARAGILEENDADHPQPVGDRRMNDGVVDVADHREFRVARRHEDWRRRAESLASGDGVDELQLHVVPSVLQWLERFEPPLEKAFVVGTQLDRRTAQPCQQPRVRDFLAPEPTDGRAEVAPGASALRWIAADHVRDAPGLEDTPAHGEPCRGAESPKREDGDRVEVPQARLRPAPESLRVSDGPSGEVKDLRADHGAPPDQNKSHPTATAQERSGVGGRTVSGVQDRPRVGISACLLGQAVRWDGAHKRDGWLVDVLGPRVEWVPVCPEMEVGLGVPREPIRLVGDPRAPRLISESGNDLTERMQSWVRRRTGELAALALAGYVLKSNSPSCGARRVRVDRATLGLPRRAGVGLFARGLKSRFPLLPIEEESALREPLTRVGFVERIFAYARWQGARAGEMTADDLARFHAEHELAGLARGPRGWGG